MKNSAFVQDVETRLWVPGHTADSRVRKVQKAVSEYDQSFRLARHEMTGDWVICIGDSSHPVFGFGRELPRPEDVDRILGEKDIKRHGRRIMADLAREAERRRLDEKYRTDEKTYQVAEHFEHAFRKEGRHANPRIFVPRSI